MPPTTRHAGCRDAPSLSRPTQIVFWKIVCHCCAVTTSRGARAFRSRRPRRVVADIPGGTLRPATTSERSNDTRKRRGKAPPRHLRKTRFARINTNPASRLSRNSLLFPQTEPVYRRSLDGLSVSRSGKSSDELSSVMIRNPMIGNRLEAKG